MAATRSDTYRVYLFGDQTYNFEAPLRQLLACDNALLESFFKQAFVAIHTELDRLPAYAKDSTPKFSSIADLVSRKRDGVISPALEQAMSAVHAFAHFIWRHTEGKIPFPTSQGSTIIGLCTGAIAAAAVSVSENVYDLIPRAVDAVKAALHCGLTASRIGASVSGDEMDGTCSWSLLLTGQAVSSIAELINQFNATLPPSSRVYLSAYISNGVTVSGPPHILSQLRATEQFQSFTQLALPIRAPYHAPHLFREEHISETLESSLSSTPSRSRAQPIQVVSCGTGSLDWASSFPAKLEAAIGDVFIRPLMLHTALDQLSETVQFSNPSQVNIIPIGTTVGESVHRRLLRAMPEANLALDIAAVLETPSMSPKLKGPLGRSKIAVIGMSGRFPGASDPEGLWSVLMNKLDMCREVPGMRWNVETHVDPAGKERNKSKVKYGCWIDNPDMFDAKFFSISPREAPQVDPAQRIALMTAYEAMEGAGIVPGRTTSTREDRVGVFYGVTSNDWCEANSNQNIDTYFIPGANRAFIPGRINFCFKFSGPSYAVDTACSSSLSAIHIAYNSLLRGDIDMAIAGGTNVLTNPDMTVGLDKGHFLSSTGNCKTFDASADGYCRGEGVATVILKRLDDAVRDNDPILGVIAGAYTNHSAEAESITRPHVGAQRDILNRILDDSGTNPYDVGYIEMHGTGTQAGDSREMQSVCSVFSPNDRPHRRPANQPLHLGALKSNIGHGESVSGVSALIKVLLMMRENTIPPHCGIKTRINPAFPKDLKERHVMIDLEATKWEKHGNKPHKAIINNFSAAGGNSSILVEGAPDLSLIKRATVAVRRPAYPVAVTARSALSLKANIKAMIDHIQSRQPDLAHLSYTTTARRMHHAYRVLVVGKTLQDVQGKLSEYLANEPQFKKLAAPQNILFTFTGQGAQYPGMGRRLYEELAVFRDQLHQFNNLVKHQGFPSILPLFLANASADLADFQPLVVQLANTCMQITLARIWMSWGLKPTAVVGHSLGEYAALNVAGVLSDADTVYLVGRRAEHLQTLCQRGSHAMLAVIAAESQIEQILGNIRFEVACANGPTETVIAGPVAQVEKMRELLVANGIRTTMLNTPYAFHTSQIDSIKAPFIQDASRVKYKTPKIPVLSPLLGSVVQVHGVLGAEYLGRHARETVQMMKCLLAGVDAGVINDKTFGIEFGPHPVVAGMVKNTLGPNVNIVPTLRRNADPLEIMTGSLSTLYNAGLSLDWDEYFRDIPDSQKVIPLPAYKWDLQSYWIEYKNDFCLYKGDFSSASATKAAPARACAKALPAQPTVCKAEEVPKLESSTIHRVVDERVSGSTFIVTTECDVGRKDINHIMQGHNVDGIGLATPSVYGDIAFTLGTHVLKRFNPAFPERTVCVADMNIEKALIGSAQHKQFLRCAAKFDLTKKEATCTFSTHNENGEFMHQHSTCRITFVSDETRKRLQSQLSATKQRFDDMRLNLASGRTFRYNNAMAYNMVSALAKFDPDYQCVDETLYDNDNYEAACAVSFGRMKKGGVFYAHPAALDGLTQSGGFTMNANENTKLDAEVFVNHGWDGFELYETIRDDCQYRTHVKMTPAENAQWKGDIVIFTGDRVVGTVKGVCLQGVPRRVLKFILTSSAGPPKVKSGASKTIGLPAQKPASATVAPVPVKQTPSVVTVAPVLQAVPALPKPAKNGIAQKVIQLIAEQALVNPNTFTDETNLEEIGIDSLLTLMISGALMEDLGIAVEPTFFVDCPTIADIKKYFGDKDGPTGTTAVPLPVPIPAPLQTPAPTPEPSYAAAPVFEVCQVPQPDIQPPQSSSNATEKILDILSEETGLERHSLTDSLELADAGVDSLLSLIITSRFREELDLNIEPDQFSEQCATVAQLRSFVAKQGLGISVPDVVAASAPTPAPASASSYAVHVVKNAEPASFSPPSTVEHTPKLEESASLVPSKSPQPPAAANNDIDAVLHIISEEVGVGLEELGDSVSICDIGLDSLLSLIIGSRFRDELDIDLGPDSILLSLGTIGDLRSMISGLTRSSSAMDSYAESDSVFSTPSDSDSASSDGGMGNSPVPATTSVVLQGNPHSAQKALFIFPDGSGSATSYVNLPKIKENLVVYGLNSPFLKSGDDMHNVALDDIIYSYVAEVRRRQPKGPYSFAGWSAGGTLSFRASQMLTAAGELVNDLILLDAPVPSSLGILPQHFFDFCQRQGFFGDETARPKWLFPHFKGLNVVLNKFNPVPFTVVPPHNVHLIWATKGSFQGTGFQKQPGDPADLDFLLDDRTDFTPGGWAKLLPGVTIQTAKAEGESHFTMLKGSSAAMISQYIANALS